MTHPPVTGHKTRITKGRYRTTTREKTSLSWPGSFVAGAIQSFIFSLVLIKRTTVQVAGRYRPLRGENVMHAPLAFSTHQPQVFNLDRQLRHTVDRSLRFSSSFQLCYQWQ